jgi:S-DNA-T family DNA segregation ATPase FtsK/SpoIIIE
MVQLFFICFSILLFTLAFGIQWNKTWATLKNTPAYLQDLFYKNIPQHESAYDLTEQLASTETPTIIKNSTQTADSNIVEANDTAQSTQHSIAAKTASTDNAHHQLLAEKLFADVVAKEQQSVQSQEQLQQKILSKL